jgi:glycosyltransferase involved in cell wall biosynthesis
MTSKKNIRIGYLIPNESVVAVNFISKRIKILEYVYNKVVIIRVKNNGINTKHTGAQNLLVRIISYLNFEFKTTYTFIKNSKNIDVLFFSITSGSLVLPQLVSKLLFKKNIYYTGGSTYECTKYGMGGNLFPLVARVLEDINYKLSDGIITEGESQIDQLRLHKYKNKVFPYGATYVDVDKLKIINPLNQRKNIVGFIGRLSKEKGIENFIEAAIILSEQNPNIEFIIGGTGPLENLVTRKIYELGLQNRIRYIGWIPHDNLAIYLNELKLIVIPSYTEGLPNIILEAMACGTPVLTSSVGAIPDIIKDRKTGFILKNNQPATIAEEIIKCINYNNIEDIAINARGVIDKNYTIEAACKRFMLILNYNI